MSNFESGLSHYTKLSKEHLITKIQSEQFLLQKGFKHLICLEKIEIKPKKWQYDTALKVLNDMRGTAILADEVGLGKTIEAGLIMKELVERGLINSILILVPAPLVEQWKAEMLEKFNLNFHDFSEKEWEEKSFILSSLPYASRSKKRQQELQDRAFDLVIVDEAHCLKNHTTATYKFVYGIKRKNTILMSATPIQNDMKELFNLVNILKPGHFSSRRKFKEEYVKDRFTPQNVINLKRLISDVMIRHRRSNTLVELPKRNVSDIAIELTGEEKIFHDEVLEFCKYVYEQEIIHRELEGRAILLLVGLLKQNCSSPNAVIRFLEKNILTRLYNEDDRLACKKIIEKGKNITIPCKAKALVEKIKSNHNQCIVYTEFLETVSMLDKTLNNANIKAKTFHGHLNKKQKNAILQSFKDGEFQVLISTESGSQGLNLQHCHILFNYDLPWNPMRIEQRIGRVHRFGQKNEVEIYTITTKGTIDEYVLYILTSKVNLFEMVIGELDTIMSYMVENSTSLEVRIGKIILDSKNANEIESELRKIGEEIVKAKKDFKWDESKSNKLLNDIGVVSDD